MVGIKDPKYAQHFFSGVVDLHDEVVPQEIGSTEEMSLQELCAHVLGQRLLEQKEKSVQKKRKRRKQGRRVKTSHWRIDVLTKEMKKYTAEDASCSIDIWLKLTKDREDGHFTTSAKAA